MSSSRLPNKLVFNVSGSTFLTLNPEDSAEALVGLINRVVEHSGKSLEDWFKSIGAFDIRDVVEGANKNELLEAFKAALRYPKDLELGQLTLIMDLWSIDHPLQPILDRYTPGGSHLLKRTFNFQRLILSKQFNCLANNALGNKPSQTVRAAFDLGSLFYQTGEKLTALVIDDHSDDAKIKTAGDYEDFDLAFRAGYLTQMLWNFND